MVPHTDRFEATPEQRRLWFVDVHEGGGRAYVVPLAWRIIGPFDVDALAAAVDALAARHEALRCALTADGDRVRATVLPPPLGILRVDGSGTLADFAGRPLDLGRGDVFRAQLWPDGLLAIMVHHALVDGESEARIADELWALYRGDALPPPTGLGPAADRTIEPDYWRDALAGAPPLLGLPLDRPRTAETDWTGGVETITLADDFTRPARRLRTTGFVVTVACLGVFLARWCNETDVVVGVPFGVGPAERPVGFFDNTLPVRLDLAGNPDLAEVVRRTKARVIEAMAHAGTPLDAIVQAAGVDRVPGTPSLFQVMLTYEPAPPETHDLGGTAVAHRIPVFPPDAKLDLVVHVTPGASSTGVRFEYRTALFDRTTISQAAEAFRDLARRLVADPSATVGDLALRGSPAPPALVTVQAPTAPAAIAAMVRADPAAVAIRCGDEVLSRAGLWQSATRLAARLRAAGVRDGAVVASLVPRGPAVPVAMLGIWLAGGVYLPLDPANPAGRNTFILDDAACTVVVAAGPVPEAARRTLVPADLSDAGGPVEDPPADPGRVAYAIYTSGSTGQPKGVLVEHGSLAGLLSEMNRIVAPVAGDRVLAATTVTFDISLVELLLPLVAGVECVIADAETAADPVRLAGLVGDAGVTVVQATPSVWRLLLPLLSSPPRVALCGGEPMTPDVRDALLGGAERAVNVYGPTETTIWSSAWPVADEPIAIGEPLRNNRFLVLDQWGDPAPPGIWGELWISGPALARGYLGRPELDARAFVTLPGFGRSYRTGDRARRTRDGRYEVSGRIDDQLKVRGFRIEPREIEHAIDTLPGVGGSAVVPIRVGDNVSLAALVTADPAGSTVDDWRVQWDAVYEDESEFAGWISSITRLPYPLRVMTEWAEDTAASLTDLGFERVLEIGAGSGIVTRRLAAAAQAWLAVENSPRAVEHLRSLPVGTLTVELTPADRLGPADRRFDLIVLNSVVQYFPGESYLDTVLAACWERLAPGGHLFVGDIRSVALAEAHHRAMSATDPERELLVDPGWFAALARRLGDATLTLRAKPLREWSEMAAFRFDAVLRKTAPPDRPPPCAEHIWRSATEFDRLCATPGESVVRRIPNAHNATWLAGADGEAPWAEAVTPAALIDAAKTHGRAIRVGIDIEDPTLICAYLGDDDAPARRAAWEATHRTAAGRTRTPHRAAAVPPGPAEVTEHLRQILPGYMVPSVVVRVPSLPLLPSGKTDRRAAQRTALDHLAAQVAPVAAPADPVEAAVHEAWARVLAREAFTPTDDFFRLGGDSLGAVRMLAGLRRTIAVNVPLAAFLRKSTFGAFCDLVRSRR
ncbi:non-ribosomal peptide synthetase [Paractinoplanes toevensis]|uniref:Carrier domain-containing protein n=1 Tax=Paractinoplanes toevensis TaxID=571911 RepID=A0A919WCA7_9ACTN|nr:non-ribosomal peptide synthetase [Actinoplanes toevensis]GIM97614.1 hypothetical protein Ato02nite_094070 [Actinoplanes toevensis]